MLRVDVSVWEGGWCLEDIYEILYLLIYYNNKCRFLICRLRLVFSETCLRKTDKQAYRSSYRSLKIQGCNCVSDILCIFYICFYCDVSSSAFCKLYLILCLTCLAVLFVTLNWHLAAGIMKEYKEV